MKFLNLLAFSEGTSKAGGHLLTQNDGYDVIVTGLKGPEIFTDYSHHPFLYERDPVEVSKPTPAHPFGLFSTAAGRYQFILRTWLTLDHKLSLPDFGPASQDAAALELIRERDAITLILDGNVQQAISLCSNIWASLPGNDYDQGAHSMGTLLTWYDAQGVENA